MFSVVTLVILITCLTSVNFYLMEKLDADLCFVFINSVRFHLP